MKKEKQTNSLNNNDAGLFIQVILMFFVLVFAIITYLQNLFLLVTEILLALLMFTMAYNNEKTFKRKGMTYVYLITGIVVLIISIVLLFK